MNLLNKVKSLRYANVSHETINELLILILIFFIYFPVHITILSHLSYYTGEYSDYLTYHIYAADFAIALLLLNNFLSCFMWNNSIKSFMWNIASTTWKLLRKCCTWNYKTFIVSCGTLLVLAQLFNSGGSPGIQIYQLFRLASLILLFTVILKKRFTWNILALQFFILGTLQSIIAIAQFANQKSLVFKPLGESLLATNIDGVAKIVSHGTTFIRSYGTLPHPNILAGLLVISVICGLYIFQTSSKYKYLIYSGIIFNILGLSLTFSRAGILAFIVSCGTIAIFMFHMKQPKMIKGIIYSIIALTIFISALLPLYIPRNSTSDTSFTERKSLMNVSYETIKHSPLLGVGSGNFVFHMKQLDSENLKKSWEFQPVHNVYLLILSELGLILGVGYIIFLIFGPLRLFKSLVSRGTILKNLPENKVMHFILCPILLAFMVISLFDHYLITYFPFQALLFIVLGFTYKYNQK